MNTVTAAAPVLERDIVVLGAGPAGVATALGLRRLGYAVTVLGVPRSFDAIEGVSDRVVAGLRSVGIEAALAAIHEPSARRAIWGSAATSVNSERLVDRARLDALLWEDLRAHGVECLVAQVQRWEPGAGVQELQAQRRDDGQTMRLRARWVVEARGRFAPHQEPAPRRGPQTLALLWRGRGAEPGVLGSAVESLPQGWAWMARLPDGACCLQLTVDAQSADLPPRAQLAPYILQQLAAVPSAQAFLAAGAQPVQALARTSTAVLPAQVSGDGWIRVGDAALAADPLSGNGIFQSLSSALQAPAVVHTLLAHPEDAAHARRFHHERVHGLFERFARIGRDFYAQETRWADEPFWAARRQWPDDRPVHALPSEQPPRIEQRPVIDGARVRLAEVLVTALQPLGVWHVDGVSAAELWRAVQGATRGHEVEALLPLCGGSALRARSLLGWLHAQGGA